MNTAMEKQMLMDSLKRMLFCGISEKSDQKNGGPESGERKRRLGRIK
jgi:hypothetical protein